MKTGVSKERRGEAMPRLQQRGSEGRGGGRGRGREKGGGNASSPTSSVVAASPKQLFPPLTYPRGLPEEPPEPEIARFE